jgi:DNA-binding response OmpR family regulator
VAGPDVVAVVNTSEDTTDLLRVVLEQAGFVVVTAFTNYLRDGKLDFQRFVEEHEPKVIVYDVAVPYEQNWALFQHFRSRPFCKDVRFVVTTTNANQVQMISGGERLIEIVGKPYDLDQVVAAVRNAMAAPKQSPDP